MSAGIKRPFSILDLLEGREKHPEALALSFLPGTPVGVAMATLCSSRPRPVSTGLAVEHGRVSCGARGPTRRGNCCLLEGACLGGGLELGHPRLLGSVLLLRAESKGHEVQTVPQLPVLGFRTNWKEDYSYSS